MLIKHGLFVLKDYRHNKIRARFFIEKNMRDINNFTDSSDDEAIVDKNPYDIREFNHYDKLNTPLILKKLENIQKKKAILGKPAQTHQSLLKNPAVEGVKKKGGTNKSPSLFSAPLMEVKKTLDAVPSNTKPSDCNSIIPSYRGLAWQKNWNSSDFFYASRVHWQGEHHYSSSSYAMVNLNIADHTKDFFIQDKALVNKHAAYIFSENYSDVGDKLKQNNSKLEAASNALKSFFELADVVKLSFSGWKKVFTKLRDSKTLSAPNDKLLSFSQILSYIYVNGYDEFKHVLINLESILNKLDGKQEGVLPLKTFYIATPGLKELLSKGNPFLSEGQIPRHSVLYAFRLKEYTKSKEKVPQALYTKELKPQKGNVYLGKLLITNNPNTLFSAKDKAVFIPDFDEAFDSSKSGGVIGKMMVGEKEIQHKGANLQGKVTKSINIKLPKFNDKKCPARYEAKYGLSDSLYSEFKKTFAYLNSINGEYGSLSWLYLETVLLAHLIEFHEIQSFNYCNKMALDAGKNISWFDRNDKQISNPFPVSVQLLQAKEKQESPEISCACASAQCSGTCKSSRSNPSMIVNH